MFKCPAFFATIPRTRCLGSPQATQTQNEHGAICLYTGQSFLHYRLLFSLSTSLSSQTGSTSWCCPFSTAPIANLYLLYLPFWPIPVSFPADTNCSPGALGIPNEFSLTFCCSRYSLCLTPLSPSYDHVVYQQLTQMPVSHEWSLLDPFN